MSNALVLLGSPTDAQAAMPDLQFVQALMTLKATAGLRRLVVLPPFSLVDHAVKGERAFIGSLFLKRGGIHS